MGLGFGKWIIKGAKANKKASGSYFLTDPSPKVVVKDPDTIKLNKQIKRIKQGAAGAVGAMGGAAVYRKVKKNKKEKNKDKE
jgi:hypothetical protein